MTLSLCPPGPSLWGVHGGCLLQVHLGRPVLHCPSPALPGWPLEAGDFVTCCLEIRAVFCGLLCEPHLLNLHGVSLTKVWGSHRTLANKTANKLVLVPKSSSVFWVIFQGEVPDAEPRSVELPGGAAPRGVAILGWPGQILVL